MRNPSPRYIKGLAQSAAALAKTVFSRKKTGKERRRTQCGGGRVRDGRQQPHCIYRTTRTGSPSHSRTVLRDCSYMLYPLPDLANFYLLSYLEKNGFQTEIVNAVLDELSEEEFIQKIKALNPKALILHSVILAKPLDLAVIPKILSEIEAPILIHGPEPSRVPKEYV